MPLMPRESKVCSSKWRNATKTKKEAGWTADGPPAALLIVKKIKKDGVKTIFISVTSSGDFISIPCRGPTRQKLHYSSSPQYCAFPREGPAGRYENEKNAVLSRKATMQILLNQTCCGWRPRVWRRKWRPRNARKNALARIDCKKTLQSFKAYLRGSKKDAALRLMGLVLLLLLLEKLLCRKLPLFPFLPRTSGFNYLSFNLRVLEHARPPASFPPIPTCVASS